MKELLRDLLPPIALRALRKARNVRYGFSGDYANFQDAAKHSSGYQTTEITESVAATFEQSKSVSNSIEIDGRTQQIMAALSVVCANNLGPLRLIDFGGGGGHYYFFQIDRYLRGLTWHVVETPKMVEACSKFATDRLTTTRLSILSLPT